MKNTEVLEFKWGTQVPINYKDSEYGNIQINVYGICCYKINNTDIPINSLQELLYSDIMCSVNEIVTANQNKNINILSDSLSKDLQQTLITNMQNQNVTIENIKVKGISMTEDSEQKVKEIKNNRALNRFFGKAATPVTVINVNEGIKDGQNKCSKCGSTDITFNPKTGKLRCDYCRYEFESQIDQSFQQDITQIRGDVIGAGATNIVADVKDMITLKCSSCGAEVVIDTNESAQARCHWCRSMLSLNQQVPNGAVPDVLLPFKITKEVAQTEIENFVAKRKFFAHPKFKEEFTTNNIMGVYFPYMLVDVNAHATFIGEGEHETRRYMVGNGDRREMRYDAELYHVEREFDVTINGLSVESSSDKLNKESENKTNNVINAIMPFDIENCVKFNANYIKGFTSEKRDTNIEQLRGLVGNQSKDVAKFAANNTLNYYDRGVAWSTENLSIKGQQWKAAYLPVWLYSYQQQKSDKKILHYVAVNARTKEVMGSVPIHFPKLILMSILVEILGIIAMLFVSFDYREAFLLLGFIFYFIMYMRYRNKGARHKHETETKSNMANVRQVDQYIKERKGLSNRMIEGGNNSTLSGNYTSIFENLSNKTVNK